MSNTPNQFPLSGACEGCPVRQIIDCDAARLIGTSAIYETPNAWERFTDGQNPPVVVSYPLNGLRPVMDRGRVQQKIKRTHDDLDACAGPGNSKHCQVIPKKQLTIERGPWLGKKAASPEGLLPYLVTDESATNLDLAYYANGNGYSLARSRPFSNSEQFNVGRSLRGDIKNVPAGTVGTIGTDIDRLGTHYAQVELDGYASVAFRYAPVQLLPKLGYDLRLAQNAQYALLRAEGVHMLLNGWDIEESELCKAVVVAKHDAEDTAIQTALHQRIRAAHEQRGPETPQA